MIECSKGGCQGKWYHFQCVGLTEKTLPAADEPWYCNTCRPTESTQPTEANSLASTVENLTLSMGSIMEQMAIMQQQLARQTADPPTQTSTATLHPPHLLPSLHLCPPHSRSSHHPPPSSMHHTTTSHQTPQPAVIATTTPPAPQRRPPLPELPSPAPYDVQLPAFTEDIIVGTAIIPKESATRAIRGQYVDLSTLLHFPSTSVEEHVTLKDGQLRLSGRMSGRPITSFLLWLKAWGNYEELLIKYHPRGAALYPDLAAYRRTIQEAHEVHRWKAVYGYDTAFRLDLARRLSLQYNIIDTRLYISNLNAKTLRDDGQRCFRCQSTGHPVRDCPFPEGQQGQATKVKEAEICNNFNDKYCTFASCKRRHVCRRCHGPQPASECDCI